MLGGAAVSTSGGFEAHLDLFDDVDRTAAARSRRAAPADSANYSGWLS
jgi:hypothetical protein